MSFGIQSLKAAAKAQPTILMTVCFALAMKKNVLQHTEVRLLEFILK
jgi:hypothetical protein